MMRQDVKNVTNGWVEAHLEVLFSSDPPFITGASMGALPFGQHLQNLPPYKTFLLTSVQKDPRKKMPKRFVCRYEFA